MTSIRTVTGRYGRISVGADLANQKFVLRTTQWALNHTLATTSEWGDSDSEGYTNRAFGRRDATFTAEGKFDSLANYAAYDQFQVGFGYLYAVLWMGKVVPSGDGSNYDDAAHQFTNLAWVFPRCLALDFNMTVDMDTEEVIGWTSSFGSDGIYYRPGQTFEPPLATVPDEPPGV